MASFKTVIFSKGMFPNHSSVDEISWTVNGVFEGINTVKINEPGVYDVSVAVTDNDGSTIRSLSQQITVNPGVPNIIRVSTDSADTQANNSSLLPASNSDGRYVACFHIDKVEDYDLWRILLSC